MEVKRISILGCGWLGFPLAKHLISKGLFIKGSTTSKDKCAKLQNEGITPFLLNLFDEDPPVYANFLLNSEVIIINIPPGRAPNVIETYRDRILRIVPYISISQKVLFISSTSVYQNTNTEVTENLALHPEKNSGKAILNVEKLLQELLGNRLTILRFSGLIGYDRQPGRFLANKKELKNGNAPVNLIHRDDCIGLIDAILEQQVWGEIINGCADGHPLKNEYYTLAAKKIGLKPPEFVDGTSANYKIVSNTKSKELLGYSYVYQDPSQ